jgi:hypothetical protein
LLNLKPERIDDLGSARRKSIMERSMEDISSVFEDTRRIVEDVRRNGDSVALKHYKNIRMILQHLTLR